MYWGPHAVDGVFGRGLSLRLLLAGHFCSLRLQAFRAVKHHLNHGVFDQRGEAKKQTGNQPDVNGFHIGDLGQFRGQRGALRRERKH